MIDNSSLLLDYHWWMGDASLKNNAPHDHIVKGYKYHHTISQHTREGELFCLLVFIAHPQFHI